MRENGVYVTVVSGGNAAGKVKAGDIIMKVNGLYIANTVELIAEVNRHHVGETVILTVLRGESEILEIPVILSESTAQ